MSKPPKISPTRLRHHVLEACDAAHYLADLLQEIAPHAKDPAAALRLASKAHEIALAMIGPTIFGRAFQGKRE